MSISRKFSGLSLVELPSQVRSEVERPFEEKLERSMQLIRLWCSPQVKSYVSCSFGKDSMVVLYLALQAKPDIPVLFVNTGVDHRETLAFRDQVKEA